MKVNTLRIGELSKYLGVNIQTLRRWDADGKLKAQRMSSDGHRIYDKEYIEDEITTGNLGCIRMCKAWTVSDGSWQPLEFVYSATSSDFANRLHKFEQKLSDIQNIDAILSLITSTTGEIGNNSYDHNLGNWPDIQGIFFGYNINMRQVVLADRGRGLLTTLRQVRPELKTHEEALYVAFTEMVSGRAPENRGNGLKYVRKIITEKNLNLYYQSGDVYLELSGGDKGLNINELIKVLCWFLPLSKSEIPSG
ncbi:MAG: helix-turn-helix domain-containing protein [Candidatus Uhrbacteria bacterium]